MHKGRCQLTGKCTHREGDQRSTKTFIPKVTGVVMRKVWNI